MPVLLERAQAQVWGLEQGLPVLLLGLVELHPKPLWLSGLPRALLLYLGWPTLLGLFWSVLLCTTPTKVFVSGKPQAVELCLNLGSILVLHEHIFRQICQDLKKIKDSAKNVIFGKQDLAKKQKELTDVKAQLAKIEKHSKTSKRYNDEVKGYMLTDEALRIKRKELEEKQKDFDMAYRVELEYENKAAAEQIRQKLEEVQREKALLEQQGFKSLCGEEMKQLLASELEIAECFEEACNEMDKIASEEPELKTWVEKQRVTLKEDKENFEDSRQLLRQIIKAAAKSYAKGPQPLTEKEPEEEPRVLPTRIECSCGKMHAGLCHEDQEEES